MAAMIGIIIGLIAFAFALAALILVLFRRSDVYNSSGETNPCVPLFYSRVNYLAFN